MLRSQLLDTISAYILAKKLDHPTLVAIDGMDNSGKTILAKELLFPLRKSKRQIIHVSIDDFSQPKKYRNRRGDFSPEGYYYDSFDLDAVIKYVLEPLSQAGSRQFYRQLVDIIKDHGANALYETASENAILLFDGIFLQRQELDPFWDIRIFIEIDTSIGLQRAFNQEFQKYQSFDLIQKKFEQRNFPAFQIYLKRCRPYERADVLIENSDWKNPTLTFQKQVA